MLLEGREHFEDEALLVGKAHDLTAEKSAQGLPSNSGYETTCPTFVRLSSPMEKCFS